MVLISSPAGGQVPARLTARHYLDALEAVPNDPDADQIGGRAMAPLIRAAERIGASALATASYATAPVHPADLSPIPRSPHHLRARRG